MKIQQFMDDYCQDIIASYKDYKTLFKDADDFYFEKLEQDDTGHMQKVIYVDSQRVFINDILALDIHDFEAKYPGDKMIIARKNYLYNIEITEGEDVLIARRKAAQQEKERIEMFSKSNLSGLF